MKLGIIMLAVMLGGCGGAIWGDLWVPIDDGTQARDPLPDADTVVVNVGDPDAGGCVR